MYICVIVSTVDVNDCIFCANEQQKVYKHCSYSLLGLVQWSQERLETMLMQNFGGTNKAYYGIFESGLREKEFSIT